MREFNFTNPSTLDEASKILKTSDSSSALLAGGTDLLSLIKHEIIDPENLVNIKNLNGFDKIVYRKGEGLKLGAFVRISDIAEHQIIKDKFTVLSDAASVIASPQLRNMGTIGGNLCQRPRCWYYREEFDCIRKGGDICYAYLGKNKYHCIVGGGPCYIVHPSDTAVALTALDAKLTIYSNGDYKTRPIQEFFILPEVNYLKENILEPGEIVTEIFIPEPKADVKSKYIKFMERNAWDFAVVSVACVMNLSNGKISSGKLAWGGVAPVPWQEAQLNQKMGGLSIDDNSVEEFSKSLFENAEPLEHNEYKLILAKNLTKRIIKEIAAD